MDSTLSSSPSESRNKPAFKSTKQYICYKCNKTFDSLETLDSHKRVEHSELGQSKPLQV